MKIWFQNRRNKWKRQIAADNEASNLRAFPGVPLFLQSNMANLHAAAAAAAAASSTAGVGLKSFRIHVTAVTANSLHKFGPKKSLSVFRAC